MIDLIIFRVLQFFFNHPYKEVYLRDLAKRLKLSPYTIKSYADYLLSMGVIKEKRVANLRYFSANMSSLFFRHLKIAFSLKKIESLDLVNRLRENISNVSSITLFGSIAKGEDTLESDIDLVVIGKERKLHLSSLEKKSGRTIGLHVYTWVNWKKQSKSNPAFYYDVITYGISLFGEVPVVR